jgi:hypothetical protein
MGETTGQIESQIRTTRDDLSANLSELEQKVKNVADWRQQFQKSPGTFLAVAAGGGLLLALLTNGRRAPASAPPVASTASTPTAIKKAPGELGHALNDIKAALIGTAALHAKDLLSKWIPGFEQQVTEAKQSPSAAEVRSEGSTLPH